MSSVNVMKASVTFVIWPVKVTGLSFTKGNKPSQRGHTKTEVSENVTLEHWFEYCLALRKVRRENLVCNRCVQRTRVRCYGFV